jgi:hypothetical protein
MLPALTKCQAINNLPIIRTVLVRPGSARSWGSPKNIRVVRPYGAQSGTNKFYACRISQDHDIKRALFDRGKKRASGDDVVCEEVKRSLKQAMVLVVFTGISETGAVTREIS